MKLRTLACALGMVFLGILLAACEKSARGDKPTPTVDLATPCAFVWATQPLEDVAEELTQKLTGAGVQGVEVGAQAFGENCINNDGSNRGFGAMSVDIALMFNVPETTLQNPAAQGKLLEPALRVVRDFTSNNLPREIGSIQIVLRCGTDELRLNTDLTRVTAALEKGFSGAELMSALFGQ